MLIIKHYQKKDDAVIIREADSFYFSPKPMSDSKVVGWNPYSYASFTMNGNTYGLHDGYVEILNNSGVPIGIYSLGIPYKMS